MRHTLVTKKILVINKSEKESREKRKLQKSTDPKPSNLQREVLGTLTKKRMIGSEETCRDAQGLTLGEDV